MNSLREISLECGGIVRKARAGSKEEFSLSLREKVEARGKDRGL